MFDIWDWEYLAGSISTLDWYKKVRTKYGNTQRCVELESSFVFNLVSFLNTFWYQVCRSLKNGLFSITFDREEFTSYTYYSVLLSLILFNHAWLDKAKAPGLYSWVIVGSKMLGFSLFIGGEEAQLGILLNFYFFSFCLSLTRIVPSKISVYLTQSKEIRTTAINYEDKSISLELWRDNYIDSNFKGICKIINLSS